jgi:hypothetical protein
MEKDEKLPPSHSLNNISEIANSTLDLGKNRQSFHGNSESFSRVQI